MLPLLHTEIPGPGSQHLSETLRRYESHHVTYVSHDFPVFWEKAEGCNVWDVDGNRFIDLVSGFGVATTGYATEVIVEAFRKQSSQLYHGMGDVHPARVKAHLCRELSKVTYERWNAGEGKSILSCAGFEAVEAALKTAYLVKKKSGVIAFSGSYHGLGFGAVTVTEREEFRKPFQAQLADFAYFIDYPDKTEEDWRGRITNRIAQLCSENEVGAIIVEPMQGRGGERIPPKAFLTLLRDLADEHDLVFILDEILTGFYRTGEFFACEHESVVPDLICLGKALSGSYPIAACTGKSSMMDNWPISTGEAIHTSTFLGNPLGCSLALASLGEWQKKGVREKVKEAERLWSSVLLPLAEMDLVKEVRGQGLLWGVELDTHEPSVVGRVISEALGRGWIILGGGVHGNVISIAPSMVMTEEEVSAGVDVLRELLVSVSTNRC